MTRDEVIAAVTANSGKRIRVTYSDGVTELVNVTNVDIEGFSCDVDEAPGGWWAAFDHVICVELPSEGV